MKKYILSRKCSIFTKSDKFFLVARPNVKLEISKKSLNILSHFNTPQYARDIISLDINNINTLSSLLNYLIKINVLVKESDDKADLLDKLYLIKKRNNYFIYLDKKMSTDIWARYSNHVDHAIELINNKFKIQLNNFNVCIFLREKLFNDICGDSLPKWVTCLVYQDCIIQKAGNGLHKQTTRNSYNVRGMIHELGHIISYKYCRHIPNWLAEGISEYIAETVYPSKMSHHINYKSLYNDLCFFIEHPDEMLISHDSNIPHENKLYFMAGLYVKIILKNKSLKCFLSTLSDYDLITPMHIYLANKGFTLKTKDLV